ncbi:MAG TPA: phospholipase D-like domain-containing protein [Candidatus Acidoferrum sp.]|nr:phospholipase D-like domain-containing protein [Candidatus Acidoferrum sp.]
MSPQAAIDHPSHAPRNGQSARAPSVVVHDAGLTVKAYRGDGCVLIAMDVQRDRCEGLAGFAIARSTDGESFTYTLNRLSFKPHKAVTASTSPEVEHANAEPSNIAPYQKFHWVDYPPDEGEGPHHYRVEAMYFASGKDPASDEEDALRVGATVTFTIALGGEISTTFKIGFTRGYISSQAFADRYPGVRALRPDNTVTYRTLDVVPGTQTHPPTTYKDLYRWLGAHGRSLLDAFLEQCLRDGEAAKSGYDVFAYDLDEPDFIRVLAYGAKRGWPIRLLLDNSTVHTKPRAREIEASKLLGDAGVTIKRGHFRRYAHDKCIIQRDREGNAVRVLTGSANFSVRGLYVQSNSVIVINDADVAALYGQAFEESWNDMSTFASSEIAAQWFSAPSGRGLPRFDVSFAPHTVAEVSLARVSQAISSAKSSVLFAVMELGGGGEVLAQLRDIQKRPEIFSFGVTQTTNGLNFYKSGEPDGLLVPFGYLKDHVPEPFRREWNGGMGQVIHHKFIVIDFNGDDPVVFCGSSNLAEGGEESNGDNLLAIHDPLVASLYAVQAIQLVDHYEFRAVASRANANAPLLLAGPGQRPAWWETSYDPASLKNRERELFVS